MNGYFWKRHHLFGNSRRSINLSCHNNNDFKVYATNERLKHEEAESADSVFGEIPLLYKRCDRSLDLKKPTNEVE